MGSRLLDTLALSRASESSKLIDLSMPEQRLWAAVLQTAIVDFIDYTTTRPDQRRYSAAKQKECRHAFTWIYSDKKEVGSFLYVCDIISPRPDDLAREIRAKIKDISYKDITMFRRTTMRREVM